MLHYASEVRDFYDEDEVRRVYYAEAERVIAEATGASKVFVFDHTLRRRVPGAEDRAPGAPRQPATGRACRSHREVRPAARCAISSVTKRSSCCVAGCR